MAASCIVCFIGLPASGKTTFSVRLKDKLSQDIDNVCVLVVSLDSIISLEDQQKLAKRTTCDRMLPPTSVGANIESEDWKKLRHNIVVAVDHLLTNQCDNCTFEGVSELLHQILCTNQINSSDLANSEGKTKIIIVDDNLYYRSMRYDYFQLARKYRCGFVEIYMKCGLATAIKRNHTRKCVVPEEVISNMSSRLEEPAPGKYYWEENVIVVDSEKGFTDQDITLSINGIVQSLSHPYQPVEDGVFEKELSRMITSRNALHQIDTMLRQLTSHSIKKHKDQQESGSEKCKLKEFSLCVNAARTNLFNDIKMGVVKFPDTLVRLIELGQIEQFREEASEMLLTMLTKRIQDQH